MQISILSLMLAFGLPGANSCNAQQQDLPRVNQNPPVAAQGHHHGHDADDDMDDGDAEDADDDSDADEEMVEVDEVDAYVPEVIELGEECTQEKAKSECKASCGEQAKAQNGDKVVRLKEKDFEGKVQTLRIEPGSTVVLETKNGKQVVLRAQSPESIGLATTDLSPSMLSLNGLTSVAQPGPQQPQDERVRELEQRVRELEAQLRERDGQRVRTAPRALNPLGYTNDGQDPHARQLAQELRARAGAQARDQAKQSRIYAEEMRKHGEEMRKHAQEQAGYWRGLAKKQADEAQRFRAFTTTPEGDFVEIPRVPAVPGEGAQPPDGAWWDHSAPTAPTPHAGPTPPKAMKAPKAPKPPKAGRPGMAGEGADAQDMQALLEQMREQMEEMRAQMRELREELQNAPRREMR